MRFACMAFALSQSAASLCASSHFTSLLMSSTNPSPVDLVQLQAQLRQFTQEREWEQFHTPKNLASALAVEAAELLEPFQWLKTGEMTELDSKVYTAIRYEMADVLNYLVMLADQLNVDLLEAAGEKMQLNALKYPVALARGQAKQPN